MVYKSLHDMTPGSFSSFLYPCPCFSLRPYWPSFGSYKCQGDDGVPWHLYICFEGTPKHFLKWLAPFTVPPAVQLFQFVYVLTYSCYYVFDSNIPVGVKRDLTLVLICICLMTNDVEHLFKCLLAVYAFSLEKKVYSNPYPYFILFIFLETVLEFIILLLASQVLELLVSTMGCAWLIPIF